MAAPKKKAKKKETSFTTWKLNLENTINADPLADGECLQIVRAYLDFMGSPDARPYRSLIDLQVDTALAENTIIRRRKQLVELGYFVADSRTSDGATRYRIVNARENLVLDHQIIAREKLREIEAEKKEKVRKRRKLSALSPSPHEGPLSPSQNEGLHTVLPLTACGDSPSPHEGNYVDKTVEGDSYEEGRHLSTDLSLSSNSYSVAHHSNEQADPLPVPDTDAEASEMIEKICVGYTVSDRLKARMKSLLKTGALSPMTAKVMLGPQTTHMKEDAA